MYSEDYNDLLKRVVSKTKKLMVKKSLTQREMIMAGLDPTHINNFKKGKVSPTLKTLWKICVAYDINPKELF